MFINEEMAEVINKETGIKEVFTEPDEVNNLGEFEELIWKEKFAIRIYPDGEKYEIGEYDPEDGKYYY